MATEYVVIAGVLALVALAFGGLEVLLMVYATIRKVLFRSAMPSDPGGPTARRADDERR